MKTRFAALVVVALGAAANMMASSIVALPTGPQNFTYDLSLPSITVSGSSATENDSTHFDIQFSWLGPEMYNAGPDTSCPLGCPVTGTTPGSPAAGFTFHDFAFTASTSEDCATTPTGGCGEALVTFNNGNAYIVYSLIEPDLFWSTDGLHTFAAGDGVGSGASWIYQPPPAQLPAGSSELPGDPPCTGCSVTTSHAAAAPEPGAWLLLMSGLGAAVFVSRRRRSVSATK